MNKEDRQSLLAIAQALDVIAGDQDIKGYSVVQANNMIASINKLREIAQRPEALPEPPKES